MSLILDALKKAERERNREAYGAAIPGLSTESAPPLQAMTPSLPSWALATLLLLLALMVLGFWVWVLKPADEMRADAVAQAETVAVTSTSMASTLAPLPALVSPPTPPAANLASLTAVDWTERVDGLYHAAKASMPKPAPVNVEPASPSAPQPVKAEGVTRVPQSAPKAATPVAEHEPDDELRSLWQAVRAGSEAADEPAVETSAPLTESGRLIPYLHQLPESFQSHIPTLMYANHIYSAEKGGAVILNDKSYREGDTLAPDLVIERITETDLLLRYRGKPFRLAALSSWVTGKPR